MTPEQARQKIINKVLSLKTGWCFYRRDYVGNTRIARYVHADLPKEIYLLVRTEIRCPLKSTFSIMCDGKTLETGGGDSILRKHMVEVLEDINKSKKNKEDSQLIAIAESL